MGVGLAHPGMTPGEQVSRCELSCSNTLHTSGQTRSILGHPTSRQEQGPGKSRGLTPLIHPLAEKAEKDGQQVMAYEPAV